MKPLNRFTVWIGLIAVLAAAMSACLDDPGVPCGSGYCPGGYICSLDQTCVRGLVCGNSAQESFLEEADAACQFETVQESERNEDGSPEVGGSYEGNDFSTVNPDGPYEADTYIAATLAPAGDEDVFMVTNRALDVVRVRVSTHDAGLGLDVPCYLMDTMLVVRDIQGRILASNDDRADGLCSTVEFDIEPGETVYAHVLDFGDDNEIRAPGYWLAIDFQ